ncbi:Chromobox protein homolog 5 [Eumeta japonica]|uniref:Chromobox protein homolog 5 n=1 Tax=Eumeta variegata TaxID=151549 RepID=A0A4C1U0D5_EUMVA|nr:Chromobox protein homolog 5 [Eumeta japonica]
MRKLSKSRTDDDMVSSTNGSVNNDEPTEKEQGDIKEDEQPAEDSVNDKESENEIIEPPKKRGSKNKTKKRKPNKDQAKADKSEDEEEYEVEKVIDSKKVKGKIHYLIRWKGYGADSDTWEPENTLSCPDLIAKFNEEVEAVRFEFKFDIPINVEFET